MRGFLLFPFIMTVKAFLVLVGFVVVPLSFWRGRALPDLFQIGRNRPDTIWEAAIRNPVGGFGWIVPHPPEIEVRQWGEIEEPTAEGPWFQWRIRGCGWLSSIRFVWRYSDKRYGEFYLGWKLLSDPPELDFAMSPRLWATIGN